MNWKNNFKAGVEIILATSSSQGRPNANIVISLGFIDDQLLVADCQMATTIDNLKENSNVCVIAKYLKIKGKARIFKNGKYFDLCLKKSPGYEVKHAILIKPKQVFDLDKAKKII